MYYGTTAVGMSSVALLAPLGVALLVYCLGLMAYRRQKEHELVRQRYLDEGVDLVASRLEETLSAYRHNWFHAVQIVKYMKRVGNVPEDLLDKSHLIMPEPSQLEIRANYRLSTLVGDPVFYCVQQIAVAFTQSASAFIRDNLCTVAEKLSAGVKIEVSPAEAAETYLDELYKIRDVSERHSLVIGRLPCWKERRWFCARDRARPQEGVRNEATLDSGDDWQRPDGCHVAL